MKNTVAELIDAGRAVLGIELGSTRIKSVLIDDVGTVLANGVYQWENRLENGIWTYAHEEMIAGLQGSYADLAEQVKRSYGVSICRLRAIGLSGMMHGYLAFDENWELLTPFRTWRNTVTYETSEFLTELFHFHIPQRWGVAHLCQAILNREAHLSRLRHQSTLAGYLHYRLTGENVIGLSEASGMFPIDGEAGTYDPSKIALFEAFCREQGYPVSINALYPTPRSAGECAGFLTDEGARLLDPSGALRSGIPFCPPEGDGGTGMVASDCIRSGVGSLSMGTSAFAMAVLEQPLKGCYRELDVMATPTGKPTVLVHCNNCTGEIDAWVGLLSEAISALGLSADRKNIYEMIYRNAFEPTGDGTVMYNYISGEHITNVEHGIPMMLRSAGSALTVKGISKALVYSALATLRMGMDILMEHEHPRITCITGHGGFFKTPTVGQTVASAAFKLPIAVLETAGEGGAWAMALLALYATEKGRKGGLEDYLETMIFSNCSKCVLEATKEQQADFDAFMEQFQRGLTLERDASNLYGNTKKEM